MLTCRQTSQLISESLDRPLPFSDRIKIKFHLFLCAACNRFNIQIRQLCVVVKMLTRDTEDDDSIVLSEDAKVRISKEVASASTSKHH